MRLTIIIISLIAIALALAVFSAGPGTRLGLWEFTTGLKLIFAPAKPLIPSIAFSGAICIAAIASVLASIVALLKARRLAPLSIIATISVIFAAMIPLKMQKAIAANPFIHDITTDFANPPQIVAAADLPRGNPASYDGADLVGGPDDGGVTVSMAQQKAFPDIVPLKLPMKMDQAVALSRQVITEMKMEILADAPASDATDSPRRIEAVYTSRGFA
ncbi:MAG: hypothetical protein ACR2RV_01840, partial [Verrucomicrobiales bacterium]